MGSTLWVIVMYEFDGDVKLCEEGESDAFWCSLAVEELVDGFGVVEILALLVVDLD